MNKSKFIKTACEQAIHFCSLAAVVCTCTASKTLSFFGWVSVWVTAGLFPLVRVVSAAKLCSLHFRPQYCGPFTAVQVVLDLSDLPTFSLSLSPPSLSLVLTSPMMTLMHSIMATPSRRAQVRHLGLNLLMGGSSVGCWEATCVSDDYASQCV